MNDSKSIYNVFFRIEAGYNGGYMSRDQHDRFYVEIRSLFTNAGFHIEEDKFGCPEFILGKTKLYCHPESLSGPTEEVNIAQVEKLLQKGQSFRYLKTDRYDLLYDFTPEEELVYYRRTNAGSVVQDFLNAFNTDRKDHYKYRNEILDMLVQRYMVHTVRSPMGTPFDSPCIGYVHEMYEKLRKQGLLIQIERKDEDGSTLYYCRSANAKERRILGLYETSLKP